MVSFLLGISTELDLLLKFSVIPYNEFRQERENLFDRQLSSKVYRIRNNLDDYLFDLEYKWSILEDCTDRLWGMAPPSPGPYRNYESPFFEIYEKEEHSNMR